MKNWWVALALVVSVPAFAHVKIGTYKGTTPEGAACEIEIKSVTFVDNVRHPLNERIEVAHQGVTFALAHPPVVDFAEKVVDVDHGQLAASKGVQGGAMAAMMTMEHSAGKEGPGTFTMVFDNYRDAAASTKSVCGSLVAPN